MNSVNLQESFHFEYDFSNVPLFSLSIANLLFI